ncbi:MAG: PTS glucose transporter subunit IIA [Anaerocolumna sp.]
MFSFLNRNKEVSHENEIMAFLSGKVIPIEEVPDEMFSKKVLGEGLAIIPTDTLVKAPADGVINAVMTDSKHACGLQLSNGMEILIHIGIDTVNMNGDGFELFVKEGNKVKVGDPLIKFNPDKIKAAGFSPITILAITEEAKDVSIIMHTGMEAITGKTCIISMK